jgi:3-oxoacyl-[acyl-carrier-protein] synthase-3
MPRDELVGYLVGKLLAVQASLGCQSAGRPDGFSRFADWLDSMAMTELLAVVATDCGTRPGVIEECVNRELTTVAALADGMVTAGIFPQSKGTTSLVALETPGQRNAPLGFLTGVAASLPATMQPASEINRALGRPEGWLEKHAGIQQRRVWANQGPLAAAAEAAAEALAQARIDSKQVSALLLTSEAPPLLPGLGAALHARLGLSPGAVALEVGGASAGFLMMLWTGQSLLGQHAHLLLITVEAPSRYLHLQPGTAGEAAALFGDAAAAAVLSRAPPAEGSCLAVHRIIAGVDGHAAHLLRLLPANQGGVELHMQGIELAGRAVGTMAENAVRLANAHGLAAADLAGVVAHGGNGRMPPLLARKLGIPPERVWSTIPWTGNLGSASLPVTWALQQPRPAGIVVWTTVGAGLVHGAALVESP